MSQVITSVKLGPIIAIDVEFGATHAMHGFDMTAYERREYARNGARS
jgi:hypothetical protein